MFVEDLYLVANFQCSFKKWNQDFKSSKQEPGGISQKQ